MKNERITISLLCICICICLVCIFILANVNKKYKTKHYNVYHKYDVYETNTPVYNKKCIENIAYCIDSFKYSFDTISIETTVVEIK